MRNPYNSPISNKRKLSCTTPREASSPRPVVKLTSLPHSRHFIHAQFERRFSHRLLKLLFGGPQVRVPKFPSKRAMRASPPFEKRRGIAREHLVGRRARLCQGALQGFLFRSLFREAGDAKTLSTTPFAMSSTKSSTMRAGAERYREVIAH